MSEAFVCTGGIDRDKAVLLAGLSPLSRASTDVVVNTLAAAAFALTMWRDRTLPADVRQVAAGINLGVYCGARNVA